MLRRGVRARELGDGGSQYVLSRLNGYQPFSAPSPGEPHSHRLLANGVADADRAGAKDLGAQAATVDQPFDHGTPSESL